MWILGFLALPVCLPPSRRPWLPGAAQSAGWEQDALQALNGVSGDLRLLPDVALKTLIPDGVLPAKGRREGGGEAQPCITGAHRHVLSLFSMFICDVYSL